MNRSSRTVGLKILEDRPVSLSALRTFAYNSDTGQTAGRIMRRLALLTVGLLVVLVLGVGVGTPPSIQSAGRLTAAAFTVSFSYSPSTTAANSQTQGMVTFSGGAVPFKVWLNQTPPGCDPGTQPFVTSTYTNSWNCTPTTAGTYNVLLDAVDNTGTRVQTAATLTVQSGGNSGNGNGNGSGTNPLAGLDTVLPTLFIFAFVFLGALVALAAGVVAMAVLVSRRLRQLTEAMKGDRDGSKSFEDVSDAKPPT